MARRRGLIGAVLILLACLGVFAAVEALGSSGQPQLAGAELIGGNGRKVLLGRGIRLQDVGFGTVRESRVLDVRSDDNGRMWVLGTYDLVRVGQDLVIDMRVVSLDQPWGHVIVGPNGEVSHLTPSLGREYGELGEQYDDRRLRASVIAATGSYLEDGTMLFSAMDEARVVAVTPDGVESEVVVSRPSAKSPDAVVFPYAARLTVVALDDGRIALAANAFDRGEGDGEVFIVDDGELERLDTSTSHPIRRIFPGPDGDLLALDGPNISRLDPDTGDVDVLVDLSEVADELEPPASLDEIGMPSLVSATDFGDDLIFTAENRIWRLTGVFAESDAGPEPRP